MENADDLVTIATYITPTEAHVGRFQLEGEGIEACVMDEHNMNHLGALVGWGWEAVRVRLQVRRSDAKRAAEILNTDMSSLLENTDKDP